MIAPCKDCKERHFLCHSKCQKYLAYKKLNDEARTKHQIEEHIGVKPYVMKKKVQRNGNN